MKHAVVAEVSCFSGIIGRDALMPIAAMPEITNPAMAAYSVPRWSLISLTPDAASTTANVWSDHK